MTQIPRVAVQDAEQFHLLYASQNQPVIITNFQDGWADKGSFSRAGLKEQVRWILSALLFKRFKMFLLILILLICRHAACSALLLSSPLVAHCLSSPSHIQLQTNCPSSPSVPSLSLPSLLLPFTSPLSFHSHFYLHQFENDTVRVSVSESGRFDGPESGSLWGIDPRTDVLVRPPATSMLLGDFLALTGSATRVTKETFYVEYLALSQYLGQVPHTHLYCAPFCCVFLGTSDR